MSDISTPAGASAGRSHLGADSRITGELQFPGTVELPGYVSGRVDAAEIVIEETGEVEGEVHAASVAIKGRFRGKVVGGTVRLYTSARVTGDIEYETLSIDSGAQLEGQCTRQPFRQDARKADQVSGSPFE
ncbi:MAG: polymer-forming cytoskeletal protein [Rubellimicrobium sp.]|nr:polymer-forming cytoskeletal protein [Rubellimicrobium sp.]